jgi:hypothetical protein
MDDYYFHLNWIFDLVKEQEPERLDVITQLENIGNIKWIRQPYITFVPTENPNQFNLEYDDNVVLNHPTEGTIVIDILKGGRIKGIEFISQIPQY